MGRRPCTLPATGCNASLYMKTAGGRACASYQLPAPDFASISSLAENKEKVALELRKELMVQHGAHGYLADRLLQARDDSRSRHAQRLMHTPEYILIKSTTSNNLAHNPVSRHSR